MADTLRVLLPWHPFMAATSPRVTTMTGVLQELPIRPTPLVTIMPFKPMPCHRALEPLVPGNKSQEIQHFSRTQTTTALSTSASSTERPSLARITSAPMLQAEAARQSSRIGSRPTSLPPPSVLWAPISATHEHTASRPWASSITARTVSPTIMPPWQGPATIILTMKWPKVPCLLMAHIATATHKVIASMTLRPTVAVHRRRQIQLPTA